MRAAFTVAVWLIAAAAFAQPPRDYVGELSRAKADLIAAGVNLSSPNDTNPCGPWSIIDLAAWRLRESGVGLLAKDGGNQCRGYSVDVLVFKSGACYDVLVASGEANSPAWNPIEGGCDASRWREPVDPATFLPSQPPGPPPNPPVPAPDLSAVLLKLDQLSARVEALASQLESQERADAAAIRADVAGVRSELKEHRDAVQGVWSKVLLYIAPAVAATLGVVVK